VARDQQVIHFRCAEPPTANPDKYRDELGLHPCAEARKLGTGYHLLTSRCQRSIRSEY
jgi:hypothetical protein